MNDKADQPEPRAPELVLNWIKQQFLNWQFIGFVVAIGLTIYLFIAAQKAPEVSYHISVVQVFNAESSSQSILLTDLAGRQIGSNVYAAEIVIWNSGNAPVDKEKVRVPIKIKATDGAGILGYEFLRESEAGVSGFTIGKTSLQNPTAAEFQLYLGDLKNPESAFDPPFTLPELDVGWQYFDDGHGVRARVLFMADHHSQLTVVGNIYPSGNVVDRTPGPGSKGNIWIRIISLVFIVGWGGYGVLALNVFVISVRPEKS